MDLSLSNTTQLDLTILHSDMNPNMEIIVISNKTKGFHSCFNIALISSTAYDDWFENERDDIGDTAIGDYIEKRLEENGFILGEDYKMYFDAQWDRTEILV